MTIALKPDARLTLKFTYQYVTAPVTVPAPVLPGECRILGYMVMQWTGNFVSLSTCGVITEEYNMTVHREGLIGSTEYLTL
jgi:hypothetical protein